MPNNILIILGDIYADISLKELYDFLSESAEMEVHATSDTEEAKQLIKDNINGILLFKIVSKTDLARATEVMREHRKLLQAGLVKAGCINITDNRKIEVILKRYGCREFFDKYTKPKTIKLKVDFWQISINKVIKKIADSGKLDKLLSKNHQTIGQASNVEFTYEVPGIVNPWILEDRSQVSQLNGKWEVHFIGPSPQIGHWDESSDNMLDDTSESKWKFIIDDEAAAAKFFPDSGTWIFEGNSPTYSWKDKKWIFKGKNFHLFFYGKNKQILSRAIFENGKLVVSENPKYSEELVESLKKKITIVQGKSQEDPNQFKKYIGSANNLVNSVRDEDILVDNQAKQFFSGSLEDDNFRTVILEPAAQTLENPFGANDTKKKLLSQKDDSYVKPEPPRVKVQVDDDAENAQEQEMLEVLSGNLTKTEEAFNPQKLFSSPPDVNTESGDVKTVLYQKTKDGNKLSIICEFEDMFDDELIVIAPKNSLRENLEVEAKVNLLYNGAKVKIHSMGNIQEIEDYEEYKELVVIKVSEVDSKSVESFMQLYQERQASIVDFMQKAKGL